MTQVPPPENAHVLVVDDHAEVREGIRDLLLQGYPGLCVDTAADAETALQLAARQRFDVVLMDIGLPGMDGFNAIYRMRPLQPQARFLVVSVHESAAFRDNAKAVGAAGFVPKRHLHAELLVTLGDILRGIDGACAPQSCGVGP